MLTPKQEAFCIEYFKNGGNATAAYKASYSASKMTDKSVWEAASVVLRNDKVTSRLKELRDRVADFAVMTKADVLQEAMKLARFDIRKLYGPDGAPIPIHQLDSETAAAVQAVDIQEEYKGSGEDRVFVGYTKKYKIADKNAALEKLFKHFGLYEEDHTQAAKPFAALLEQMGARSAFGVKPND